MSYGFAYSNLFIKVTDEALRKMVCDDISQTFELNFNFSIHKDEIGIELKQEDVCSDFDTYIEELAQYLMDNYPGLKIDGYFIYDGEGRARGEVDDDGAVQYASCDWLDCYTIKQIEELREYAENHFKN